MSTKQILLSLICFFILAFNSTTKAELSSNIQEKKADSLYKLAWDIMNKSTDSALYFAKQHQSIVFDINDYRGKVVSYFTIGVAEYKLDHLALAAYNYYKGLNLLKDTDEPFFQKLKVSYLKNLGVVYESVYDFDNALEYTRQALELARSIENDDKIAILFYNMGVMNEKKEEFEIAKKYYNKAIKLELNLDAKHQLAISYNSLGNVFNKLKQFDSARIYYMKALEIGNDLESLKKERAIYLSNLGENYFKQSEFQAAKEGYLKALAVSKNLNDIERMKFTLNNLGDVCMKEKKYEEAINYYMRSIELAQGNNIIDEEYERACKHLAIAYNAIGNHKLSSEFALKFNTQLQKVQHTKENLAQQNAQYRMKEVEWKLEKEAQLAKIAKVETENIWIKILVAVALIVIIVGSRYSYLYYRKIRLIKEVIYLDDVDEDDYV